MEDQTLPKEQPMYLPFKVRYNPKHPGQVELKLTKMGYVKALAPTYLTLGGLWLVAYVVTLRDEQTSQDQTTDTPDQD